MIDLHLHLDGSLTPAEIVELSRLSGVELPTYEHNELRSLLTFDGRGTLNDYLTKFDLPLSVMQSAECVEYAVRSLVRRLKAMGYTYAEIRFAPVLHTAKGATQEEILLGAVKGLLKDDSPYNLVLCCMRGRSRKENIRTVELAAEFRGRGVVGVDLAGAEALYPTENYKEVFSLASRLGVGITVHAGEAAGEDSIRAALDMGAYRIGHGTALKSKDLIDRIIKDDILLEVCPTSNVQTGAAESIEKHPLRRFLEAGVPVALSSDNMTVSDTSVFREWEKVKAAFGYSDDVFKAMTDAAMKHAFPMRIF